MVVMSRALLGPVACDRMLRDGVVAQVGPGHVRPLDVPESARDRATSLAAAVPSHTVLSASAGLWVRYGGEFPGSIDVVGRRGLHRHKPGSRPGGAEVAFHSGAAATEAADSIAGVRVAPAARCAADALRWSSLADAIPRVWALLDARALDPSAVAAAVATADPRGAGAGRERSAWSAIWVAWRR